MKKILLVITMILILYNPNIMSQFNGFEWSNPKPQGNKLNSIGFFNANDGIAIGNFGTLLKTSNGGSSWDYIMIAASKNLNALDIVNANTAFIAGDSGLILKTTNSGSSWLELNSNLDTNLTSIKFLNENIGYAAGLFGTIIKTTDGGINWSKKVIYYNHTDIEIINSNNAFIVGDAGTAIRTTDGGNIWFSMILSTSSPLTGVSFTDSSNGYIVGGYFGNGVIFKTTDSGQNWVNIFSGENLPFLNIFYKDSNNLFTVGYQGTIKRTTDAGISWTNITVETQMDLLDGYFVNSNLGFIVGTGGKLLKTTDGGNTWNSYTSGNENYLFAADFIDHNIGIAVGHNKTILKTTDGGINWTVKNLSIISNPLLFDIKMLTPNYGIAVGWYGFIHITTDAGETWNSYSGVNSQDLRRLDFIDNNIGYAAGYFGTISKTTDAGLSWNLLNSGSTEYLESIDFINPNLGFVCGSNGQILKTTNAGATWNPTVTNTNVYLHDIAFFDSSNGFAIGQNSTILKTSNSGLTWDSVYGVQYGANLNAIKIITSQLVYVAGDSGIVFFSNDGGLNWNILPSNTNNFIYGITVVDSSLYFFGENGTILKFTSASIPVELTSFNAAVIDNNVNLSWSTATELNNSGFQIQRLKASKIEVNENWQNIGFVNGIGTSTEAHTYAFQDHETTSGKYQYRLKQIDFDGSFEYSNIVEVEIGTPVEFILAQNFPNPFNPGTNISWQTPVSGQQTLKVYDVLGNEVAVLVDEFKSAGSYQVEFNAEKLSSGVYFYKLQIGSLTQTKKMQLIK